MTPADLTSDDNVQLLAAAEHSDNTPRRGTHHMVRRGEQREPPQPVEMPRWRAARRLGALT